MGDFLFLLVMIGISCFMSITKLEIGGGKVKIGIPLSDKAISLDEKDLLSFKEGISNIV